MLSQEIGKNVLVVDDNEDARNSLKLLLELIGLHVSTVEGGEEAIKEINTHKYDLLIFDVSMPRIDGVELFQVVRNSEEHRGIPVLFTSGFPSWTEPEEHRRRIFNNADGYIQKPFNTDIFLETIQKLLQKRNPIA